MLGLESAGFSTLVANELHPHPCMTLRRNFPGVPVVEGSIRDLSGAALLNLAGVDPRRVEVDLVAGGPPCQGFSTAGLKDKADPRNTLVGDFVRIVDEVRPRYFLMENVTGLQTMHGGRLFENVLNQFDQIGYRFHFSILFAANFGVPQMRRRLVILGSRDGVPPQFPEPTHASHESRSTTLFSSELLPFTTCGDAIGDLPAIEQGQATDQYLEKPRSPYQRQMRKGSKRIFNHQATKHRDETASYYSLIPPGGTALDIPIELRGKKQGIQRWPMEGLARTITTEPTDFLHPRLDRVPTIRELARIQSFPDRFEFLGQRTTGNKMRRLGYCSQSQQVGNAVPPLLAEAVGRSILTTRSVNS